MMQHDRREDVHRLNCLSNDLDALYHLAARRLGVPDSVLIVAYMIHEKGDGCLLYDVCSESGLSKQTINSALRRLERDNVLYLEQDRGKTKRIRLTETGRDFVSRTAARLFEAECSAFASWTDEEFALHLRLMEKYKRALREEIDKWKGTIHETANPAL